MSQCDYNWKISFVPDNVTFIEMEDLKDRDISIMCTSKHIRKLVRTNKSIMSFMQQSVFTLEESNHMPFQRN